MVLRTAFCSALVLTCSLFTTELAAQESSHEILFRDSFEKGARAPTGWQQGAAVPGVKYVYDRGHASHGARSLSLQKSAQRYFPIAAWTRRFPHQNEKSTLEVATKVKAEQVTKAIVDVAFLDAGGNSIQHEWVAYIGKKETQDPVATHDWKDYSGIVPIPAGTKQIVIGLQIYGPGKVWFDALQARYVEGATSGDSSRNATASSPEGAANAAEAKIPAPVEVQTASGALANYLLVPPSDDAPQPQNGFPLLLVLPGGDGSAEFHPFVRRIHKHALDGRFIVAQPIAPPHIVWPTAYWSHRFATTEEAISAVIDDVAGQHTINRDKVFALAWSSSGPAAYATILQKDTPLAGALIAMSVFKPDSLPELTAAKGRRIYLLHSPDDTVCPYRMAQSAEQRLGDAGAQVKLVDYAGGHGWHGPVFDNIRDGIKWLYRAETR